VKQCGPGARYMFINFANEDEREKAIAALDGFVFKKSKLRAFKSK
jgi:RNA recognition motif-containing protein